MNEVKEFEIQLPKGKNGQDVYALIIYDIVDNKRRNKLVSFLQGYGFRVQKSCFEVLISKSLFNKLKGEIAKYATKEDSIRIYKIQGTGQVICYGANSFVAPKDIIII